MEDTSPDYEQVKEMDANCTHVYSISQEEVRKAINDTKKDTAEGTDKWKLEDVVKFSKEDIAAILNKWYLEGTILIFKAG